MHVEGIPALPGIARDRAIDISTGEPVGQRGRGIVLQDAEARTREGKSYATRDDAKHEAFKCIELCCNARRMHSSLGYRAPSVLERVIA